MSSWLREWRSKLAAPFASAAGTGGLDDHRTGATALGLIIAADAASREKAIRYFKAQCALSQNTKLGSRYPRLLLCATSLQKR